MQTRKEKYKLGLLQMQCEFLDRKKNLAKAESMIRCAASEGAAIICLPESFDIGYDGTKIPDMMSMAQGEDGETVSKMRDLASEFHCMILAPCFCRTDKGVENRAYLIDDDGSILGGYSKTHPVGEERKLLQRGREYPVFDTQFGRIGISICYDACFPETGRILALKGAELLLVPAAWRGNFYYREWWDLDLASRALDNLCYVAAVNMCGPTGKQFFAGKSQIVSPIGEKLYTLGVDGEGILIGSIDLGRIVKERAENTVLTDRHPEDYEIICK